LQPIIFGEIHRYMNIKSIDATEIKKIILRDIDGIKKSGILNSNHMIVKNISTHDPVQSYMFYSQSEVHDKILKPILLDTATRAEMISGGAGEICLRLSLLFLERAICHLRQNRSHRDISCDLSKEIDKLVKEIKALGVRSDRSDIYKIIDEFFNDEIHKEIIHEIIKNTQSSSPIFIERSNLSDTIIESLTGFNFKINISPEFLPASGAWRRSEVNCMVIDGIIESVGEIHHLLEFASSSKEPFVIFSRGMSDDVKSTLLFNIHRGTINLIPVCVGFDEKTLNILNDISIACNSEIVSSYKGDLISSASKGPFDKIKRVSISEKEVSISSDFDSTKLYQHIRFLRKKRDDSETSDLKNLFDDRIRSLSSNRVTVKIGTDMINKNSQTLELFDKFFREFKMIVQRGVITSESVKKIFKDDIAMLDIVLKDNRSILTMTSICAALKLSLSCTSSVISVGNILLEDQ